MSGITHTPVVSIAYHSGYGHTAVVAEAVRSGAADAGATVHLIKVDEIDDAQWELLDGSDAIVFGSPTYMGTASGAFHVFAEATSKRWFGDAWQDKVAAGFTNSASKSGDKLHTLQYFQILAAQHGMSWVNLGLKPGWNSSAARRTTSTASACSPAPRPRATRTRARTPSTRPTSQPPSTWAVGSPSTPASWSRAAPPWPRSSSRAAVGGG